MSHTAPTAADRAALIKPHLGVRPMPKEATAVVDSFQLTMELVAALPPEIRFRAIAEMQQQLSMELVKLAGGR